MKISNTVLLFLLSLSTSFAQSLPFLDEIEYEWMANEISGDAAFEHIRHLTQFHRPGGGSEGLMESAIYVEEKAREFGLKDVKLIKQKYSRRPWSASQGEIWLIEPHIRLLASMQQVRLHLADYSRTTNIERAEVIDVGSGTREKDYEGKDIKGKIVLAFGQNSTVMSEAVWKRGALGVLNYPNPSVPDYPANALSRPDQIHWGRIPIGSEEDSPGTFAFQLSARQALELKQLVKQGEVIARVDIEASFGKQEDAWQVMVEAFIPGTDINDQDIVLTAHLQEEKFSANDDASGCASILEIGRALARLINNGQLDPPGRNIRFWWVTEISSQRQYFADNPDAPRQMLVNINQDMVGANQAQDVMRVQNMMRVPFSRFHFLNDVAEATLEFIREGNTANLAVLQAGTSELYPKPVLSRLGSRHRYNASIVPFHNNTDHMPFNEAPIGIPGITFTNWPDNYIHTSDDDLWNVDQTQLQRNALTVGLIAYSIASANVDTFHKMAAVVLGKGLERLSVDYKLGLEWVTRSTDQFYRAVHQLEQAQLREIRAIESLASIAGTELQLDLLSNLKVQIAQAAGSFRDGLTDFYQNLYGVFPEPEELGQVELELSEILPVLSTGPADFLDLRSKVDSVKGLHPLMGFEVLCFADGNRNGLEIFRAVAAEASRGGQHYYGSVTPEMVLEYLENTRDSGLLEFH